MSNIPENIQVLLDQGYTLHEAAKTLKKEGNKARRKQLAEQRKQEQSSNAQLMVGLNKWMRSYLKDLDS
jgi:hypothetical protein